MTPTLPPDAPYVQPHPGVFSFPKDLPDSDGVPMESDWHMMQIALLKDVLETNWTGREFFCGGNMFLYYSAEQVRNREFRGPDFFVVLNVEHDRKRNYWATWDEKGRTPDFIVEFLSPTTALEDRTTKKDVYESLRTSDYICYDPGSQTFEGWRLQRTYRPVPPEGGRWWSEALQLSVGAWQGMWKGRHDTWVRFFDKDGALLPTEGEKEAARADAAEAELKKLKRELAAIRSQIGQ